MPLSIQEVASRAGVDEEYVLHLVELGAVDTGDDGYDDEDVHRVALLHSWESAGLPPESILEAVRKGELSFAFLQTPGWDLPERPGLTYGELSREMAVPLSLILAIQEAIGFEAPRADEQVRRPEEIDLVRLARVFLDVGTSEEAIRRVFHLYADNLRRLSLGEAELYQAEVRSPLERGGMTEGDLMRAGSQLGHDVTPLVHRALVAIYERHRQHVWTEDSISRAEAALDRAGLRQRVARPPAICFVDLTGYTRLTEERGDVFAARIAASLAALVEDITRSHGGRAVRWLGDGGMFLFKDAVAGMVAALEVAERAPRDGLPPTHIGIHSGPVIFQDGDVFGRAVNIASRIASQAGPGEVLTSAETAENVHDERLTFERVGPVPLKGVAAPVTLYRVRAGRTS